MRKLKVIAKETPKVYPEWFLKLSEDAQKTYIEKHPKSTPRKLWDAGVKPNRIKKLKTKTPDNKTNSIATDKPKENKTRKTASPK